MYVMHEFAYIKKVMVTMKADERRRRNNDEGLVQLHEEHQSYLLMRQFDVENAVTFAFKNQTRFVFTT